MRLLLFVAALVACASGEVYRGHRLIAAVPSTEGQIAVLRGMEQWPELDFWSSRFAVGNEVAFRVPPTRKQAVEATLVQAGIKYSVIQEDLQTAVDAEATELAAASRASRGSVSFDRFLRYGEIQQYISQLQAKYPQLVTVDSIGKSFEGRDMTLIRVSKSNGKASRAVFLDAGIHAREWIAPATAVYLINQLVENAGANNDMLEDLDWYIMPVLNPDGYEYTHTSERLWRKNRSTKSSRMCPGVDINRNFGFHWMENGASPRPCAETFAGPQGFSEIEAQNLRDYILKENANKRIKMYLTLHSYGWYILYPWGFTPALPSDEPELRSISVEANKAMVNAGSRPFTIGTSTNVLYAAAGGSDDWAKGEAGIEKSYTIELPGGGRYGFDIPASKISKTVKQVFAGLKVFAKRAKNL